MSLLQAFLVYIERENIITIEVGIYKHPNLKVVLRINPEGILKPYIIVWVYYCELNPQKEPDEHITILLKHLKPDFHPRLEISTYTGLPDYPSQFTMRNTIDFLDARTFIEESYGLERTIQEERYLKRRKIEV